MTGLNLLLAVCLAYVVLLFAVAFAAERAARNGRTGWLRSPVVYTLSLSIYCTAWTFYGAVGSAARNGFEFLTIYMGPTLVMIGWWWLLRKLVRIGRSQRITSVADLISSRFGKSNLLGVLVTVLAVIGTTPYIALQLQSVVLSFDVFAQSAQLRDDLATAPALQAFWVACGLAVFTVIFGTRNLDANERHHGVVMAIAVEAVVKLAALLAVGVFVVWGIGGGVSATLARIDASQLAQIEVPGGRWVGMTLLAAAAFLCLPRMFQVMVVENDDERHLRTASWAFPLYLLLMSLFVVPIAAMGRDMFPPDANPDLFVLTIPLAAGQDGLAMLTFLGGFSSATSMVIVAAIAVSTMVSNHIVMPIFLRTTGGRASVSGDVRAVILLSRRLSIVAVVLLGYLYYSLTGGGAALAAIGLVSFTGIAQVLPAMLGGVFWRGASRVGAVAGISVGFVIWLFTHFLPSFGAEAEYMQNLMRDGLFGLSWLRPYALFGIEGIDPLLHAFFWSLSFNTLAFCICSILSFPTPLERLQGAQFVNVFQHSGAPRGWSAGLAQTEDLMIMAQRIVGASEAQTLFREMAREQGRASDYPDPTPDFLERLERELAGSVGAATAHAMVGQIVGGTSVSVEDLLAVADESQQLMEYSARLELQSEELSRTARQLREANLKLTRLSVQKDAFLSQISHELRTPMTSIRAFSEILRDSEDMGATDKSRYASIIHDEALRLTRLLDDLLDLSVLEHGQVSLNIREGVLGQTIDHAVSAAMASEGGQDIVLHRDPLSENIMIYSDLDRLSQVFINLIANSRKYCDAEHPEMTIRIKEVAGGLTIDFIDNGSGISADAQDLIFEKFARVGEQKAGGAGLGLAISRQIMERLGGSISYLPDEGGAAFRVVLPRKVSLAAQ